MKRRNVYRVVHIANEALLKGSGFSQQIFMEVRELKRQGYDVTVVAFSHIKYYFKGDLIRKLRAKYGECGITIYTIPTVFGGRLLLEVVNFPIALAVLTYLSCIKGCGVLHFHSIGFSLIGLILRRLFAIQVINDIHGVTIEESIYRNEMRPGSARHRYSNYQERLTIKHADINFCVSNKMIAYLAEKHNLHNDRFELTRSSFDPEIFRDFNFNKKGEAKKCLGLGGRMVFIYMGHKSSWQLTRKVVEFFSKLKEHMPEAFMILLSNDLETAQESFERAGLDRNDYIVKYVKHEEVPLYCYSADLAILIRDDSIVNQVASPVKFSEYLASGAAVLLSPTIGDLPWLVEKYQVGFLLSENGLNKESLRQIAEIFASEARRKILAEKCREFAERELSVDKTINAFRRYYER